MALTEDAVRAIQAELRAARRGERRAAAEALARRFGVSLGTIYRKAELGGARRKRQAARPEYRDWVEVAAQIAHRSAPPMPLELALRAGVAGGSLPAEAAAMPLATAYRVLKELGLKPGARRTQQMHADWPMQAVQFDASTSAHLLPARRLADGGWSLKLYKKPLPSSGYKNKPLAADRQRLMIYGVWDMCTGYRRARYLVAQGEGAADAADSLVRMLMPTGDPRRPLHGIPDDLWTDQGPLFKSKGSRDLLDRLGVKLALGRAYAKERMGGVESGWRIHWARFERSLFAVDALYDGGEITLDDLNARLELYEAEENGRRLSRTPVAGRQATRTEAWAALSRARPEPLRTPPADAIRTMYRDEALRRLDRNGVLKWKGAEYECSEWHDRFVLVREALDGREELALEDPATGERAVARRYRRRPYGDVSRIPLTRLERLNAAAQAPGGRPRAGDPYADGAGAAQPAGVAALRAPAAEVRPIDNPLAAGAYPSLASAMAAFGRRYPFPLGPEDRAAVEAALEEAGLGRAAVDDLAGRLLSAVASERTSNQPGGDS